MFTARPEPHVPGVFDASQHLGMWGSLSPDLSKLWQPRVRKTGGSPAIKPLKSSPSAGLEASLRPSAPQSFSGKSRFLSAQFWNSQVHYRTLYSGVLRLLKVTRSEKAWGAAHRTLASCRAGSRCICPGTTGLSSRG